MMVIFIAGGIALLIRRKYNLDWLKTFGYFLLGIYGLNLIQSFLSGINSFLYYSNALFLFGIVIVFAIFQYLKNGGEGKYIEEWENANFPLLSSFQFSTILYSNCDVTKVRYYDDIPYNRAKYFSSGTEVDIDMDFVSNIFYDANPADNELSFQEYGFLVTSLGVIISRQKELPKQGRQQVFDVEKTYLPFANAYRFTTTGNCLTVYYASRTKKSVILYDNELEFLADVFDHAIHSGWSYHVDNVISSNGVTEDDIEEIEDNVEDYYRNMEELDSAVDNITKREKVDIKNRQVAHAAVAGSLGSIGAELSQNQINDRFGGGQGHGHVGEHYGDLHDKLRFKSTEKYGASHEKHGADRAVNGVNIQTKYHATANKSIDQCFENNGGKALYVNTDGSMMKIEVPRDQYDAALKNMAKKIEQGRVPNEENPNNAANYVKKGALTYEHSQIATKSIFDRRSTIAVRDNKGKVIRNSNGEIVTRDVSFGEKLVWSAGGDFLTGAAAALPYGVVAGLWVYCNSVWQGADKRAALKNSAIAAVKPTLTGGVIYMVSSQFAGSQMGRAVGDMYVKKFAKKQMTNKLKTEAVKKGTMGVITVAITVGPDLTDCLRGRMSMKQLVKNTVSTGVGMASGAAVGSAVGSVVPGIGNAIGAVVGGSLGALSAKKVLDNFIEDDAVSMIRISKEEFIDTIMMSSLSQEEFQTILEKTFLHKKFNKLLKSMYSAKDSRAYIHAYFLELVEDAFMARELPDDEEIMEVAQMHYARLAAV